MKLKVVLLISLGLFIACRPPKKQTAASTAPANLLTMLVGTYTSGDSKGIYTFRFDQETGECTPLSTLEQQNPSFVIASSDARTVYAVNELPHDSVQVTAMAFDKPQGLLTLLGTQPTLGADPCHLATNGHILVVANYSGGSITAFPLLEGGAIGAMAHHFVAEGKGAHPTRQEKPHLHQVTFSPDGGWLLANDLGTDAIHLYRVNDSLPYLIPAGCVKLKPGAGPRHSTFSPDGSYLYVLNELDGCIEVFAWEGKPSSIQRITADTLQAGGSADIHTSPDGRFVYASHRLQGDGISIYARDTKRGLLTRLGHRPTGRHPRNFAITPNGKFLLVACRDDNRIELYRIDSHSGLLQPAGKAIDLPSPVCVQLMP